VGNTQTARRHTQNFFFPIFVENRGNAPIQKLSFLNQHYQTDDDKKDPAVRFEVDSVDENSGFRVAAVKRGKRDR
jgi:hypothetical protein